MGECGPAKNLSWSGRRESVEPLGFRLPVALPGAVFVFRIPTSSPSLPRPTNISTPVSTPYLYKTPGGVTLEKKNIYYMGELGL